MVQVPTVATLPFPKPVGFSDEEIVSLIDFLRTNPERPGTTTVFDGSQPILSILKQDQVIEVTTGTIEGLLAGSGQTLTCRLRPEGTFEVLSISMWVA